MGFLSYAIKVPKVITIAFFLNLISYAHHLFISALTHLGLYKQPPAEEPSESDSATNNFILILDSSSLSLVPIQVHVVTAVIKNLVPVIEYE
ncbi:brassinosteroid-responsive RING protein 1-like [Salvia divinorum]|uniref:Brassinosteroid-responsive RING protein 1-like n=1 Tax=Salvia divinorum TaxID=28513 RepID=A0ABD1IKE9_SALDI